MAPEFISFGYFNQCMGKLSYGQMGDLVCQHFFGNAALGLFNPVQEKTAHRKPTDSCAYGMGDSGFVLFFRSEPYQLQRMEPRTPFAQKCPIVAGTLAAQIYGNEVNERHRHRYEVNNHYVEQLKVAGLVISARTPTEQLCEMVELPQNVHPWFVACQFHPEFTSNPRTGHPLFKSYIQAALKYKGSK